MYSFLSAGKSSCPRKPAPGLLISSSVTSAVPPRPASLSSCNEYLSTLLFFRPGSGTRSRSSRCFALRIEEKFLTQTSTKQQKSPFKALPRIHHVHYPVQGLPLNRRRPGNELPCIAAACRDGFVTAHRTNIPVDEPRGIMRAFYTGMLQRAALTEEQQELSLFQDPNNSCSTSIAALSVATLDTTKAQPLGDSYFNWLRNTHSFRLQFDLAKATTVSQTQSQSLSYLANGAPYIDLSTTDARPGIHRGPPLPHRASVLPHEKGFRIPTYCHRCGGHARSPQQYWASLPGQYVGCPEHSKEIFTLQIYVEPLCW